VSHLGKWRINGTIPFNRFVDGTRWHYGVDTFDDAAAAMEEGIRSYRKNLWRDQEYYVECWCEKEAIASLVKPVADQWGLKTFVCRGFNSLSGSASAADQFLEAMKKGESPVILYLGDHDPSGLCIDQSLMKHLGYFDIVPKNDLGIQQVTVADHVEFVRVAILPRHIEEFTLPTRPVKKGDTRAKGWEGGCVEIDTLSGKQIRELLEEEIAYYVDEDEWDRLQAIEKAEKETLAKIMHLHREELGAVA
jgi:5S rRNA maturation endonuclease (ribonuclease M5)